MHARRHVLLLAVAVGALFLIERHPAAQAKDPILGRWTLDVGKSSFAGATPMKRTMTFAAVPDGLKQTIVTTTAGNASVTYNLVYTAKFDGAEYPADVASAFSTVSLKRVDGRSVERIGKTNGQVVETEIYTVSPDGKTLRVKQEGENNGVPFTTAQVFERQ
ncbi:MAG TPA: hypothetical protein VLV86_25820 [Vicinamibacterales bacterium]|nr:hypothetical protein [Vicinamibacterales bacterium]